MKNCTCGATPKVKRFWLGGGGMGCEYEVQCPACGKHGRAMGHEGPAVQVWDDQVVLEDELHKQHIVSLQNQFKQQEPDEQTTDQQGSSGAGAAGHQG